MRSPRSLFKLLTVNLLAMYFSVAVIGTSVAPAHSQTAIIPPQKGMCYVTWDRNRFMSEYSDASIQKLSSLGVEYLSLVATQYQEKYNVPEIKRTERTPSNRSLKHVIKHAHKNGMKVLFKPHIDLIDKYDGTYWRADIGFAVERDWQKWFSEYRRMIVRYAKMCERYDVEIFCVGTELSFTTQREDEWRKIISEVRTVYSGKLVYAANWDNFKNIRFWDALDYVGIDAYFPLTYESEPSLEDLEKGWLKWISEIEYWQPKINRPVIFTEIGYASTKHAPYTPWKGGTYGNAHPDIQALCYKAFFRTVWKKEWLAGAYWWKWDTNTRAGGVHNRQFTPQNKPAQKVIEAHYKGYAQDTTYAMAE